MSATKPQAQPVPATSQEFKFDIRRTKLANDQAPVNDSVLIDQLRQRLYEAGDEFQGKYEVSIGAIWDTDRLGYFSWRPHSCGQEGVGFLIGHTFEGNTRYPGRTGSIKAPAHVDVEQLCAALNGRALPKKPPPKLQLVKEDIAMQNPPSTNDEGDTKQLVSEVVATSNLAAKGDPGESGRLALAVLAKRRVRARRDAALDRCAVLRRENEEIEAQLAARPDFEAQVTALLTELGL